VYSGHGYKGNMISTDMYYLSYTWMTRNSPRPPAPRCGFTFDACNIGYSLPLAKTGRVVALASGKTNYSYDGDATMRRRLYLLPDGWLELIQYVEGDNSYACTKMIAWGNSHGVRCTPTQKDMYSGNMLVEVLVTGSGPVRGRFFIV